MGWPLPDGMADSELEAKLLGGSTEGAAPARGVPLWPQIHEQLRRKGVTLRLLWQEYRQALMAFYTAGFAISIESGLARWSRCCGCRMSRDDTAAVFFRRNAPRQKSCSR